jgi:uncharacterized protein
MLVKIEEIQNLGLERSEAIAREVLIEALGGEGYALLSATPLKASFRKVSGRVHVRGSFVATVVAPCKRCLKDQHLELPVEFSLRMIEESHREAVKDEVAVEGAPKRAVKRRSKKDDDEQAQLAASFELDEVDAEPFNGKSIDMNPIVREQLLLALPVTVVCKEACKGLCTVCGNDLNESDCGHGKLKEVDVRLAKLKDIKLKN